MENNHLSHIDLSVIFAGLRLSSPLIIGSSGLTLSLDKVRSFAQAGAGAIVLKSLFEEQIEGKVSALLTQNDYTEGGDYLSHYIRREELDRYLGTILQYKRSLDIPVIASICCAKGDTWLEFAKEIEAAGADAIEINIMRLETDLNFNSSVSDDKYISLVKELCSRLSIPIIIKLSPYHTALPSLVDKVRAAGASAVTLFNRAYQIDIDINEEKLTKADVWSNPADFYQTLRFTALVNGLVDRVDISASSGIHTWNEVIKSILAGASTVQMVTAIYQGGVPVVEDTLAGLRSWMKHHGYTSIDEIRGRLNSINTGQSNEYERIQFMKYFGTEN